MMKTLCVAMTATLLIGCAAFGGGDCPWCDGPRPSRVERQALWEQLHADRERALAAQPRSLGCSHNRCDAVSGCDGSR